MISRSEWRMARKHGYALDLLAGEFNGWWERVWLCEVRRVHRVKFGSNGRCIRCARIVAA